MVKDLNDEIKKERARKAKQARQAKKQVELIDNPINKLLDENNLDNIILFDQDKKPIEFKQVALIAHERTEKLYAILIPVTPMVGVNEGEGVLFVLNEEKQDLEIVRDDALIDEILEIYNEECEEDEE